LNSVAALLFNDPESAKTTLAALRAEPHVLGASVFANDGHLFARYVREATQPVEVCQPGLAPGRLDGHRIEGDRLILFRRILSEGEPVGVVCLQSDLQEVSERLRSYGLIAVVVLVLSLLVGVVASTRLQSLVSEPILQLVSL